MKTRPVLLILLLIVCAYTLLSPLTAGERDLTGDLKKLREQIDSSSDLGGRAFALVRLSRKLFEFDKDAAASKLAVAEKLLQELEESTRRNMQPLADELAVDFSRDAARERFEDTKVMLEDIKQPWVNRELFFAGLEQGLWGYERLEPVFEAALEFNTSAYNKYCALVAIFEQLAMHDPVRALELLPQKITDPYFSMLALSLIYNRLDQTGRVAANQIVIDRVPGFDKDWVRTWSLVRYMHAVAAAGDAPDERVKEAYKNTMPGIPNPSRGFDAVGCAELLLDFWPQEAERILKMLPEEWHGMKAYVHLHYVLAGYPEHLEAFEENLRLIPDYDYNIRIIPREERDMRERFWLEAIDLLREKHLQKAAEYVSNITLPLYRKRAEFMVMSAYIKAGRPETAGDAAKIDDVVLRCELYLMAATEFAEKGNKAAAVEMLRKADAEALIFKGDYLRAEAARGWIEIDPGHALAAALNLRDAFLQAAVLSDIVKNKAAAGKGDRAELEFIKKALATEKMSADNIADAALEASEVYKSFDSETARSLLEYAAELIEK